MPPHHVGPGRRRSAAALDAVAASAATCVHANVATPLSVAELRTLVGCSGHQLRLALQRHCGAGPKQYILRVRLEAARVELARGAARPCTVTAVATRYGFTELGRFAVRYRQVFGERPSDTLRRTAVSNIEDSHGRSNDASLATTLRR